MPEAPELQRHQGLVRDPDDFLHFYRDAQRPLAIGSIALCGYRKSDPPKYQNNAQAFASGKPICLVCIELVRPGRNN